MTAPIEVTAEMLVSREQVLSVFGRESLDKLTHALRIVAEKKKLNAFRLATDESIRAGREGKEMAALQLLAAACEIAESPEVPS